MQLRLPFPPSINGYWRSYRGRQILSVRGRQYREAVVDFVGSQIGGQCLGSARLFVQLWLYPPDKRRRDVDNHAKAILDALTHAGLWDDDEQIDKLVIERCAVTSGGAAVVIVESLAG